MVTKTDLPIEIKLRIIGILESYFNFSSIKIELSNKANLKDLMHVIDKKWGCNIPEQLWDSDKSEFTNTVMIIVDQEIVNNTNFLLKDKTTITIMTPLMGG